MCDTISESWITQPDKGFEPHLDASYQATYDAFVVSMDDDDDDRHHDLLRGEACLYAPSSTAPFDAIENSSELGPRWIEASAPAPAQAFAVELSPAELDRAFYASRQHLYQPSPQQIPRRSSISTFAPSTTGFVAAAATFGDRSTPSAGTPELSPPAYRRPSLEGRPGSTGSLALIAATPRSSSASPYSPPHQHIASRVFVPPPSPAAVIRRRPSLPVTSKSYSNSLSSSTCSAGTASSAASAAAAAHRRLRRRDSVESCFAEMQDSFLQHQHQHQQQQQQQYQQQQQHYRISSAGPPMTPPRSPSYVDATSSAGRADAPSSSNHLYRSSSAGSNFSTSSSPTATSPYPPRLMPTVAAGSQLAPSLGPSSSGEPENLRRAPTTSGGYVGSSPKRSSPSRRPAPLNLEASPNRRRQSRLSIEVPPYQHRPRDVAHPYPTPGSAGTNPLLSPIDPYQIGFEAGSTQPLTASEQAASQSEMEQLLSQLDNFLGPEGTDISAASPTRPTVSLRSARPHSTTLSRPMSMSSRVSPPSSYGMASFEISGVTLNEGDLALLDGPEFELDERHYPASAPAWQTTFNLGPNGPNMPPRQQQTQAQTHEHHSNYASNYAPQQSYYAPPTTQPPFLHQRAPTWSPGYGPMPPTPSTPNHLNVPNATYGHHQRRASMDHSPLSAPLRRRRSSDDVSAAHPSQSQSQAPQARALAAPYVHADHPTGHHPTYSISEYTCDYPGPSPTWSPGATTTTTTTTIPRTVPSNENDVKSRVPPPVTPTTSKSPTKKARTSPTKTTAASPTKKEALVPMFVNYSATDKKKLLAGVAPSGSSKRKREEAEAAAKAAAEAKQQIGVQSEVMRVERSSSSSEGGGSAASSTPSSVDSMPTIGAVSL